VVSSSDDVIVCCSVDLWMLLPNVSICEYFSSMCFLIFLFSSGA
jgi:hypothetical protein